MDKVLIDVYLDLEALEAQLKTLRMVALLNTDPLLADLVDTIKIMIATIETEAAKSVRDRNRDRIQHQMQKEEIERMMNQAKQRKPWNPLGTPPQYSDKAFTADELRGVFPAKF